MKTFPTATPTLLIRIIEDKLASQLGLDKVHFRADKGHQSFAINDDLIPISCDDLIEFVCIFDVIHCIAEPVAAFLC